MAWAWGLGALGYDRAMGLPARLGIEIDLFENMKSYHANVGRNNFFVAKPHKIWKEVCRLDFKLIKFDTLFADV